MPMIAPMKADAKPATKPTMTEIRAPSRNCENRSRPDSSVPIQCELEGGCMRCAKSKLLDASGSCGASRGPKMASSSTIAIVISPNAPSGRRPTVRTVRKAPRSQRESGLRSPPSSCATVSLETGIRWRARAGRGP